MIGIPKPGPTRVCLQCKIEKPLDGGFNRKGRWWQVRCKECGKERNKARHRTNRDADLAANREWYTANKKVHKNAALRFKYGISYEIYEAMLSKQNGGCALCGASAGYGKMLAVDHNHATGKIRGLLCDACNLGIGKFKDSPEKLRAAAAYIEQGGVA